MINLEIYARDHSPIRPRPWCEQENVRLLFDFFHRHRKIFL